MTDLRSDDAPALTSAPASAPAPAGRRVRAVDRAARTAAQEGPRQAGWRVAARALGTLPLVSDEAVERIHEASLTILSEIGVDFLSAEARAIAAAAGAEVAGERVRLDPALVMGLIAQAPARFTLHGRGAGRDLPVGDGATLWGAVASPPHCSGLGAGRRPGRFADFEAFVRLGDQLDAIHFFGGYPVEPQDRDAATRHLDCLAAFARLTRKVFHPYCLGRDRIRDALEIVKIARGIDDARLRAEPSCFTIVNSSSPLRLDRPMLEGMIEMARARQPVCLTPFTMAGAMAPVTLAGALAQQNAEVLAGLAFAQMVSPGTPVLYGAYTSNVDMRTGAPAMGTPEYFRCALVSGQLARRYRLPYRSSGGNAANAPDAQAVWETMFALWGAALGGADMVMHAAGWLEGGLCASFGKMVIDAEILQGLDACFRPLAVTDETLALDAIREVGPGGHFFGAAHTLARYETAFHAPFLADWRPHGAWAGDGGRDAFARAESVARTLIDRHDPPPLDPAAAEALDAFVARRKAEGGARDV
jgi:trimethylamine--corrinoid protein Co-methyltransferase